MQIRTENLEGAESGEALRQSLVEQTGLLAGEFVALLPFKKQRLLMFLEERELTPETVREVEEILRNWKVYNSGDFKAQR